MILLILAGACGLLSRPLGAVVLLALWFVHALRRP